MFSSFNSDANSNQLNSINTVQKLRIGIDVGGTFTHGVIINETGEILKTAIVPTTHTAENGIAFGIGQVVQQLLESIDAQQVFMVAHSTTQATNAVLEGDLVPVQIFVLAPANQLALAKLALKAPFVVANHKLSTFLEFIKDHSNVNYSLLKFNSNLVVVVQTFADQSNDLEQNFVQNLKSYSDQQKLNLEIIEASSITRLLGLRMRTATAVLNAAMLPKIRTVSNATLEIIQRQLPKVPVSILTSDGGSMPVGELATRPLAALLSGPAAGAAAATIFSGLTDALFLEVGGTSTDISCIRNGRVELKPAQLGDAMIHLRTLDLNTIALGGGSLVNATYSCGPRSAHIAGWNYLSFAQPQTTLKKASWMEVKGAKYLALIDTNNNIFGLTLTDIVNWLNHPERLGKFAKISKLNLKSLQSKDYPLIPETDSAYCQPNDPILTKGITLSVELLAQQFNPDEDLIIKWLSKLLINTFKPVGALLKRILADHEMHRLPGVWLAGGGGGAYVVLPLLSLLLNLPFRIVPYARVISAVGAAVALDTVVHEINVFQPTEEIFAQTQKLVAEQLSARGISPESCEFRFEYDARANLLRCTGTGAKPVISVNKALLVFNQEDATKLLNSASAATVICKSELGTLYTARVLINNWVGIKSFINVLLLVDQSGRPRLNLANAKLLEVKQQNPVIMLEKALNEFTNFGDAGAVPPALWLWDGNALLDFSNAGDSSATLALIRATVKNEPINAWILIKPRL